MKTLLISQPLPDVVIEAAQARFDVTQRHKSVPMTLDEAAHALQTFDYILPVVGDQFGAGAFAGNIVTQAIGNFGVGYNHIDVAAAQAKGVAVANTPDVVTDATADIGMTLLLSIARRTNEGERLVRAGKWTGWTPVQLLGTHVTGKTVGIIGMGRIGQAVARRCHFGFGMEVVYFNRSAKALDHPATRATSLNDLMAQVDFAVICVPAGPETRHLIDGEALTALGPDSYLINIARGDVVDETALISALKSNTIRGAGLDVYANEPHVPDGLIALENVVLAPHLGTAALEVRTQMGLMALGNIIAFDEGRDMPQRIDI